MIQKIESITVPERRLFLYNCPLRGFSLKYVSGPNETKGIKLGSWLDTCTLENGRRQFHFGSFPEKSLVFESREQALAAQTELQSMVGVITEVTD
jgi:hypothetical protein